MKLPAFQFYPGDWMKNPALRACSHAARGVFIDTLCLMFECVPRGVLITGARPWSEKDWAAAVGGNGDVTAGCIRELIDMGVVRRRGDESAALLHRYGVVLSDIPVGSYYSLRLVRDEFERLLTRDRVRRHRSNGGCNDPCNGDVTLLKQRSSSSTSVRTHPPPAHAREDSEIPDEDQGVAMLATAAVPEDFARHAHRQWSMQGGRNANGIVVPWLRYALGRWKNEQGDWRNGTHQGNREKHPTTRGSRTDRNTGTY